MDLRSLLIVWLPLFLLLIFLILIAAMFVSLARQGDERRRMIVQTASANTFAVTVVYILFCAIKGIIRSIAHGEPMEEMNPIVTLMTIAITYTFELFYFKRKYGD